LYARQEESIVSNLDKWGELGFNPFGARTDEFFRWGLDKSSGGRIGELMSTVGVGTPVPLGLFREGNGGFGPHHQVIAIGLHRADLGQPDADIRVEVYDPNTPDRRRMLMPDMAAHRWCYEDSGPDERWITYFVDRNYAPKQAPEIAPAPRSADPELIAALTVEITTGGDDLRGGNDNVDVAVITRDGEMLFTNVNRSARWIDNYQQTITLDLQTPVARSNVLGVELRTRFGGGMGGDNWNVNKLVVTDSGGTVLGQAEDRPLVRLTGDQHSFRLPIAV
jgi:hypothetical protein